MADRVLGVRLIGDDSSLTRALRDVQRHSTEAAKEMEGALGKALTGTTKDMRQLAAQSPAVASSLLRLESAQTRYNAALKKYGAEAPATKRALASVADQQDKLQRATEQASRSIEHATERTGRFGGMMAKVPGWVKGAAASFATYKLAGAMQSSVMAASDLNESLSKTEQLFGKAARTMPGYSRSVATAFGMSRAAALEGASGIGAMLIPIGKTQTEAAKMSTRMLELARDMGSFNNQDPSEMLDRLRAGLSGESEPLKQFGVLLSEARVKAEAYASGIAKTGTELTEAEKVQARYQLILKDSSAAHGDFERTSGGLANQQRILRSNIDDLSARIGTVFLPALTSASQVVIDNWPQIIAVGGRVRDFITREVVPPIGRAVKGMTAFWEAHRGDIMRVVGVVIRVTGRIAESIAAVVKLVHGILTGDFRQAWDAAKTIVGNAVKNIRDVIGNLGPMVLRAARTVGGNILSGIGSGLRQLPGTLAEIIKASLRAIPGLIGDAARGIGSAIAGGIADGAGGLFRAAIPGRAQGGIVPGADMGRDTVIAALRGRERVLTEQQMMRVEASAGMPGLVDGVLARTGGVMGGQAFNRGGIVAAQSFAERARGARYLSVRPQPPGTFDCSSFAGFTALAAGARVSQPGSTATYISQISRARGGEPIVWGFRKSHGQSGWIGGPKEHMGIRINGTWWESGGRGNPAVGPNKSTDSSWSVIGVPRGLERLTAAAGGEVTGTDAAPGGAGGARQRPQSISQLLAGAGVAAPGGRVLGTTRSTKSGPVTVGSTVGEIVGAYRGAVPDYSAGVETSMNAPDTRATSRAGREARAAARAAGKSPEEVIKAGEDAEREETKRWFRREIREANRAIAALKRRKGRLLTSIRDITRSRGGDPAKKRQAIKRLRDRIKQIDAEMAEVREARAELIDGLQDLGEQETQAEYTEAYEDSNTTTGGATAPTSQDIGSVAGDIKAAGLAGWSDFTAGRTELDLVARGSSDIGSGGPTAVGAAFGSVNVTVQALHPGDPTILASIAGAVTTALGIQGAVPATSFMSGA